MPEIVSVLLSDVLDHINDSRQAYLAVLESKPDYSSESQIKAFAARTAAHALEMVAKDLELKVFPFVNASPSPVPRLEDNETTTEGDTITKSPTSTT